MQLPSVMRGAVAVRVALGVIVGMGRSGHQWDEILSLIAELVTSFMSLRPVSLRRAHRGRTSAVDSVDWGVQVVIILLIFCLFVRFGLRILVLISGLALKRCSDLLGEP